MNVVSHAAPKSDYVMIFTKCICENLKVHIT
uniref:Uncharacterized protein n=1 Tax=Rhizophora mucronata TaxID=61149 RepID=A0A2P2PW51_RHIMU